MAKRKAGARPRGKKKKKQSSSFLTSVKRLFTWAFAVFVCFIGLLFVYTYLYPDGTRQARKEAAKTEKPVSSRSQHDKGRTAKSPARKDVPNRKKTPDSKSGGSKPSASSAKAEAPAFPASAEIPRLQTARKEQIIRHEGYTVSYNSDYRIANWVAYELTAKEAKSKKAERSNKFVSDPDVKGASATNEDYTRTGYDRGHLAPAGDMKWSAKAMRESFYLSNISPQKPGLNRGIWKELEEQARLWARENGSVLIITGPVITSEMKRLGKNRVGVPLSYYKVVATVTGGRMEAVGFLLENRDYGNTPLSSLSIPVDSVEKVTGIDFFHTLADTTERRMEATVTKQAWSF